MGFFDDWGFDVFDSPSRDKRRTFTRTQKNEILYQQNNKCAQCRNPLDPRAVQFDHKKGWADKGRTITQNGRALCSNCHSIITHKNRLEKIEEPSKNNKRKKSKKKSDGIFDVDLF